MTPESGERREWFAGGLGGHGPAAGRTESPSHGGRGAPRWDGEHAERVVPVYALTRGRTRPVGQALPIESLVTVTEAAAGHQGNPALQPEWRAIMKLCVARPLSVAEIGAALAVPIGVARVLVSELAGAGYLEVHLPQATGDGGPGHAILGRLLNGLRAR